MVGVLGAAPQLTLGSLPSSAPSSNCFEFKVYPGCKSGKWRGFLL